MEIIVFLCIAFLAAVIYFLPTLIADMRKITGIGGVFVLNLFLGWTFIGWVIALAWAAGGAKKRQP